MHLISRFRIAFFMVALILGVSVLEQQLFYGFNLAWFLAGVVLVGVSYISWPQYYRDIPGFIREVFRSK